MKIVLQRVNSANVIVNNKTVGKINKGLLVFLGISKTYNETKFNWMINKLLKLRIWPSEKKGFDLCIRDIDGEILVISQFTLFGNCEKGTKPNFAKASEYDKAEQIYDKFITKLKLESNLNIQSGKFGAMMKINAENDGPVTMILEK